MKSMSVLGFGACAPDSDFRNGLPFPAGEINRDAMPAMLRRRGSRATQMAFSAATQACVAAGRSPASLPTVFASVAGEIQTTDQLCLELTKPDPMVSPAAFHNSVQNTVAGYWSIAQHSTQAATALAAGTDTFAMALLEAWCQLACHDGELLLVCYDERWPEHLLPDHGKPAFAAALVLAANPAEESIAQIGKPCTGTGFFPTDWQALATGMPVLAAIPLLNLVANGGTIQHIALSTADSHWQAKVYPIITSAKHR